MQELLKTTTVGTAETYIGKC